MGSALHTRTNNLSSGLVSGIHGCQSRKVESSLPRVWEGRRNPEQSMRDPGMGGIFTGGVCVRVCDCVCCECVCKCDCVIVTTGVCLCAWGSVPIQVCIYMRLCRSQWRASECAHCVGRSERETASPGARSWAVRLITFSGWLRVNQWRLIVPTPVECFLPPVSASAFEEG